MTNEFDYYLIDNDLSVDAPMLDTDDDYPSSGAALLAFNSPVSADTVIHLHIAEPIPANLNLADCLSLEGVCRVFSKKIRDAVEPFHFSGLQFIPVVIKAESGEEHTGYYAANILKRVNTFDQEKTEYERISRVTGAWIDIRKIVLDSKLLVQIPLEERLVYVAKEHPSFILYHKSVVDAIMSANPSNIIVTPVAEWYDRIAFDN